MNTLYPTIFLPLSLRFLFRYPHATLAILIFRIFFSRHVLSSV